LIERIRRALSPEPDLTWLGSEAQPIELPAQQQAPQRPRRRRRLRVSVNGELVLGGLIVLGLFLVVLFGPLLAPSNPYLSGQQSTMVIDGEYTTAPFPPMPGLPFGSDQWGRDVLSILLYGTRNTLVACLFIAMARVLLGSALGMLAGWHEGGIVDRAVMSLIEVTTALPALLVGMILIFALGIQGGITVFILALCFVGWSEIAQYIRGEFMVVRRKPFIEGARVVGLDGLGIAIRHILPNVLPSLVIIAVLEMGAVLMILGELGFIGVFIGGGTWVQIGDTTAINIPDIPEWGAMMAGARQFARSKSWMVFYPALAFFLAVLGFNLLGEGLRRIVQQRGVSTAFILSKRMLAIVIVISLATAYIITHVGPAPSYAGLAQRFEADGAMAHVQALTVPGLEGRQAGTAGLDRAAAYIADRFAEYGLETLKLGLDYRLPLTARVVQPSEQPVLALLDEMGQTVLSFAYRTDFGVDIRGHGGSGEASAPLALLSFSKLTYAVEEFKGLDLRGRIAMFLEDNAPPGFAVEAQIRGAAGLLLITEDITPRLHLAHQNEDYLRPPELPIIRISPTAADRLLAPEGLSVQQLRQELADQATTPEGWRVRWLTRPLLVRVVLSPVQEIRTDNVLGVFPGSDAQLNKQLVIVATHYDGPGRQPDGTVFTSANDGATGIAVMLEILRLWTARGFQPRRTVFFVAWTGGEWDHSGAHEYLRSQAVFSVLETEAVVNLTGLGRGGSDLVVRGDSKLVDLFLRAADSSGVPAIEGETVQYPYQSAFTTRNLAVNWRIDGIPPAEDTIDRISISKLGEAGQAINLALITLGREYDY